MKKSELQKMIREILKEYDDDLSNPEKYSYGKIRTSSQFNFPPTSVSDVPKSLGFKKTAKLPFKWDRLQFIDKPGAAFATFFYKKDIVAILNMKNYTIYY